MKTQKKQTTENYNKEIRRKTKRIFSSEQKIQIVMEALRAEMSVADNSPDNLVCRDNWLTLFYV